MENPSLSAPQTSTSNASNPTIPSSHQQPSPGLKADRFRPSKRPRFNQTKASGLRHGGTSYSKTPVVSSLQAVTRLPTFPIFVGNQGCRHLPEIVFDVLRAKDHRIADNFTLSQLQYVTTLAFANRVVSISIEHGYAMPANASRLSQVAKGIRLPDILAKYIEAIGSVVLPTGVTVVPFSGDYEALFPQENQEVISPSQFLIEAERPVPQQDWALDIDYIIAYNNATTRASKTGLKFRTVDLATSTGRTEMVVSYRNTNDNEVIPLSPTSISEQEIKLGACYAFRDYDNRNQWLGQNSELCFNSYEGRSFNRTLTVSELCVNAMSGERE